MNIDFQKNETSIPLVAEHLLDLRGKSIYYDPLKGNLGDDLILMGLEEQFRRADLKFVSNVANADHVLIKGGGALIDDYQSLLKHIKDLLHKTPDIPATILPTSYHLESTNLPEMCGQRTAPLRVYARERFSFDLLEKCQFGCPFELGLDHDSAFHLIGSNFIKNLQDHRGKHILIVERTDAESTTGPAIGSNARSASAIPKSKRSVPNTMNNLLPAGLKAYLKHRLKLPSIERGAMKTEFASRAIGFVKENHPAAADLPVRCFDVSQNYLNTFDQFARVIANSAVVLSTRLHVGILSAMLGIPTFVVAGSYHKLRGIYSYSMLNNNHVKIIDKSMNEITF